MYILGRVACTHPWDICSSVWWYVAFGMTTCTLALLIGPLPTCCSARVVVVVVVVVLFFGVFSLVVLVWVLF